jgi:hypothetical protein
MEEIHQIPMSLLWGIYIILCLIVGYAIGSGLAQ